MAAYTKENLCFFTLISLKRMSRGLYYNALVLDNNESNVFINHLWTFTSTLFTESEHVSYVTIAVSAIVNIISLRHHIVLCLFHSGEADFRIVSESLFIMLQCLFSFSCQLP